VSHQRDDPISVAAGVLAAHIRDIVLRINVDEFTTLEFIEALQMDPAAKRAFERALAIIPETDDRRGRMILHGQVVPDLLRATGLVEWSGYAYGHEDPYGVPAWWRKLSPTTNPAAP
jgi:hypothetical protein